MKIIKKLICYFIGHDYAVDADYEPYCDQAYCKRCGKDFYGY